MIEASNGVKLGEGAASTTCSRRYQGSWADGRGPPKFGVETGVGGAQSAVITDERREVCEHLGPSCQVR